MVSTDALCRLNSATLALFAPGLHMGNYVPRTHAFIAALISTDLIGYGALDDASGQLDARFDHHPTGLKTSLEAYGKHMHKYGPFRFDPAFHGGKPYSARDFYTQPRFHDLDIFQEVHRPLGFEDHCFVHVPTEAGTTLFFGLFREGVFRKADKELLELAQPHLANTRRLAIAQSQVIDVDFEPDIFTRCGLSPRESEILHAIVQEQTNAEIAYDRRLRLDTVSAYIHSIYVKMGVTNRVGAVIQALKLVHSTKLEEKVATFSVRTARTTREN